ATDKTTRGGRLRLSARVLTSSGTLRRCSRPLRKDESNMPQLGWKALIPDAARWHGIGRYPIAAYSEFMPPPRLAFKPYGDRQGFMLDDDDPWGWQVSEYEEMLELRPGME